MEQLEQNKSITRKKYYLIYSGIFLFCAFCMCLYLYLNGKTNINYISDGMNQHYRGMLYYSRYLKDIIRQVFIEHRYDPMYWDFSIGEGSDVITTLHSYSFANPLCLFSVFVPDKYMYIFYTFNGLLRIYLAGLFFSELCFYFNLKNRYGILAGALTYCFCYFAIKNFTMHISFIDPVMYLPLMILGVEKIIRDDRPYILVLAIAFSCVSFFYFFYMEALAAVIYGVTRVLYLNKTDIRKSIRKLLEIFVYGLLGVGLSAIILLPVLNSYLGDSRMDFKNWLDVLYPRFYYERLFTVFVSNDSPYDLCMGYASVTLLSSALVLKDYKKNKLLLFYDVLCLVFLCFPIFGKIFNGFGYVSQRWSFIIGLPISFGLALKWEELQENKKYLFITSIGIIGLSLFSAWSRNERVFIPVGLCLLFYFVSSFVRKRVVFNLDLKQILLLSLIVINIFYIYEYHLSSRGGDTMDDLLDIESAKNLTSSSEAFFMTNYSDNKDFYRYTGNSLTNNASITYDTHSTNYYFSITNSTDQKFRKLLGMRDRFNIQINGYDDRAPLESLANVRYYVTDQEYDGMLPYGFTPLDSINGFSLYQNEYCIPFGYTYKDVVSYEDWYELTPVERQETMINSIVLDSNTTKDPNRIKKADVIFETTQGITINNGSLIVEDEDAVLKIKVNGLENVENYLSFEGLKHIDTFNLVETDTTDIFVNAKTSNGDTSMFLLKTEVHRYNYDKKDFVCYLGHSLEPISEIEVSFSLPGTYEFKDIYVNFISMDNYSKEIDTLSEDHLENVTFSTNKVSGNIDLKEEKYLLLSIPYSKGWSAKVDGEKAELLRANEHYMALDLGSGNHTIELNYMTPGLKIGAVISCVSIIVFIAYIIINETKEHNKKI